MGANASKMECTRQSLTGGTFIEHEATPWLRIQTLLEICYNSMTTCSFSLKLVVTRGTVVSANIYCKLCNTQLSSCDAGRIHGHLGSKPGDVKRCAFSEPMMSEKSEARLGLSDSRLRSAKGREA